MSHKTYYLVLVLGTSLVSSCAKNVEQVNQLDAWDEVSELLQKLNITVEQAVETATTQIDSLSTDIVEFADNLTRSSLGALQASTEQIKSQLSNLKLLAEALDAGYCLDYREEELDVASTQIQLEIENCVIYILTEASNVIMDTLAYIPHARGEVIKLGESLTQCDRDEDVDCILKLRGEVQLASDELPSAILDDTLVILLLSRDWLKNTQSCADNRIGIIYAEGNRIINEVEICLLNPTTITPGEPSVTIETK